jgi:TetR/AcrR family transcriptional regulator, cholesterol catabolism regulator
MSMGSFLQPLQDSPPNPVTRFDRRLAKILEHATAIFCEKGYVGASMRDLSRASGMSLAGLYYYFESKDKLLYLVQKNLLVAVMQQLSERLKEVSGTEDRIRLFIVNHVEFFSAKPKALRLLSPENNVLGPEMEAEIAALKVQYYDRCFELVDALRVKKKLDDDGGMAVMNLFGMVNSLHTWYDRREDGTPHILAEEIGDIFLRGICAFPRQFAAKPTNSNPAKR